MPADVTQSDVIVIGAGIAGSSVAAELAQDLRIVVLERERQPGYHTTGRSAAIYSKSYGPPVIRALTRASETFLRDEGGWLSPRSIVFVARADQAEQAEAMAAEVGPAVEPLSANALQARIPLLRNGYAASGLIERAAADIDVHGVHQHYLKALRARGGVLQGRAEVIGITRAGADWQVETRAGKFRAPVLINAAGAWTDEVAALAGVTPLGIVPKRRTALIIDGPAGGVPDGLPMVVDVDEEFYLKPEAGKLLISPADETPSTPCDAQPDEMDVAICVDRIETAFDISVGRIDHKWAGLRSFLPDGCPAAGFDPTRSGFFWLAGQGGYGIQTAPALARSAAALVRGRALPPGIEDEGVNPSALAPRVAELAG